MEVEPERDDDFQNLTCDQFHAYLTALQIRYPGLSNLYSLNAARIDFVPYQYRPVLRFIRSDRPRLLIADSVGVGKTIEAGLILRELQARRDIRVRAHHLSSSVGNRRKMVTGDEKILRRFHSS